MALYPNADSALSEMIADYASAIGTLTIYWAALENALLLVIEALLQTDELTAHCLGTAVDKAAGRAELIKRLVYRPGHSPSDEWTECMDGLCNQISNVMGPQRNRLIHDDWFVNEDMITRTNKSVRIGKPGSRQPKALLQNVAAPSPIEEIWGLTDKTVDVMIQITMQSHFYNQWKKTGQPPNIPEQALRLSKGLPARDPQQEG